jgi:hypothetical protein
MLMTVTVPMAGNNILVGLRGKVKLVVTGSVSANGGRGLVEAAGQKRVPGAFVFAGEVGVDGFPLKDQNGFLKVPTISSGIIGTTTRATNGGFGFLLPGTAVAQPAIFAVSPLFPGRIAQAISSIIGDGDLSQVARSAFPRFRAPDLSIESDRVPPRISFAFDPVQPAALGNLSPFHLNISCSDNESEVPPVVSLSVVSFLPIAEEDAGATAEENLVLALVEDVEIGATRRQRYQMNAFIPAQVEFEIRARDSSGNEQLTRAFLTINRSVLLDLASKGPLVVGTSPAPGSVGVSRGEPVIIRFSEPIDPDSLIFVDTLFSVPVVSATLQDQNREMVVRLAPDPAVSSVSANISSLIQNPDGGFFDQDPTTEPNDSFDFSFTYAATPPTISYPLGEASGIVGTRDHQFAIDRRDPNTGEANLVSFKSEPGEQLQILKRTPLPPFPRDVKYLGRYHFHHPIAGQMSADLVVVVGGLAGLGQDSWIRVFDVTEPGSPFELVASDFGLGGATLPVKLAWSPPRLGILLFNSEQTSVMELDMQLLIRAQNLADYRTEPSGGNPGLDLNGDGDYVDPAEVVPRPLGAVPPLGLINGGAVETNVLTAESAARWRFTDFDIGAGGRWMVACSRSVEAGLAHRFWVLKAPGEIVDDSDDAVSFLDLDAEPSRVTMLLAQELVFPGPGGTESTGFRDLALVSQNDGHLVVIDITDRLAPAVLNKLQFLPVTDGNPKTVQLGEDGYLYVACTNSMLVLDPRYLAPGSSTQSPFDAFRRAYVHRISGYGVGNRAFVTSGLDHVAVAFSGKSQLQSLTLPADPPVINGLRLIHFVEKKPSAAASLIASIQGSEPAIIRRESKDGLLELVDPFSLTGRVLFSPLVIGEASYTPPNQVLPSQFPLWKFKEFGSLSPEPVVIQAGLARADFKGKIPAFSQSFEASFANALPLVDFALMATNRGVRHEVFCENQKVDVVVYPGFKLDRKLEANIVAGPNQPFGWVTTRAAVLVSRLTGGAATLSVESKGTLGYKAAWVEDEKSNEAILTCAIVAGCDPLVGLKGEIGIPPPGPPPVVLIARAVGAKFFVELGGAVTLVGSLERDSSAQIKESLELGGKVTLGIGAKVSNSLVEAKVSGETGLSVKAKCEFKLTPEVKVSLKQPKMSFEGLAIKLGFKSMTGSFRPTSQKFTVLEPEVLFELSDLDLL